VELRAQEHEPRARVANVRARHQQLYVISCRVFAAKLQTVIDGLETDRLAALTTVDALVCLGVDVVCHREIPLAHRDARARDSSG
jgi:hypothetical protein